MASLKILQINSKGQLVMQWQFFLRGQELYHGEISQVFNEETLQASITFQRMHNLQPDGMVGNKTFGVAMQLGFEGIADTRDDKSGANWPATPKFPPLISNEERQKKFGKFMFVSDPVPHNPENIRITDNWESQNIVITHIPQLTRIKGNDRARFHKSCAAQLRKLWSNWEAADLLHLVLTWDGSFVPRFVRGSRKTLSNHAFGSAFDINFEWNRLGAVPAIVGQKGSTRELVEIANANGFYWGGHFSRLDGMHFEVAKIL